MRDMLVKTLEYKSFLNLTDGDLYAYLEPFLDSAIPVPEDVLDRMLAELPRYDESHLVYAIEIGPDHAPDAFAPALPDYLSHKSQAVRTAASRALTRLPDRLITEKLVNDARSALASCPKKEAAQWCTFLADLEKRRQDG